jgi:hypothetical protein
LMMTREHSTYAAMIETANTVFSKRHARPKFGK